MRAAKRIRVATGAVTLLLAVPAFVTADESRYWVKNGGAETGTTWDWDVDGFSAVEYGSSASVPTEDSSSDDGQVVFQADRAGATMRQTADLSDAAAEIDQGGYDIEVLANLGGSGPSDDGAAFTAVFLDASGTTVRTVVLGPPTAADRRGRAALVMCGSITTAPVGTRSVAVTVRATGAPDGSSTATADGMAIGHHMAMSGVGRPPAEAVQGQDCYRFVEQSFSDLRLSRRSFAVTLKILGQADVTVRRAGVVKRTFTLLGGPDERLKKTFAKRLPRGRYNVVVTARDGGRAMLRKRL